MMKFPVLCTSWKATPISVSLFIIIKTKLVYYESSCALYQCGHYASFIYVYILFYSLSHYRYVENCSGKRESTISHILF